MPTYDDVLARVATFPEGADAQALQAHFVREADRGNYDFNLIHRVRYEVADHARRALDRGDIELAAGLRLKRRT